MLVIGHRGASVAAPENSPLAFQLAAAMGADGVELDVRWAPTLSGDRQLLVKHDPLPDDLDSVGHIASLSEVLTACGETMLVNVEIKNSANESGYDATCAVVEPTIAEMRRHGDSSRWIISSFDWGTIQRCRELAPDIATAFLVEALTDEMIATTAAAGHAALHPWAPTVTADLVEQCHAAGLALNTWTANDPERLKELASLGVDGVCTDVPDVALDALGRRISPPNPRWGSGTPA